jgi:hypothetical protein
MSWWYCDCGHCLEVTAAVQMVNGDTPVTCPDCGAEQSRDDPLPPPDGASDEEVRRAVLLVEDDAADNSAE